MFHSLNDYDNYAQFPGIIVPQPIFTPPAGFTPGPSIPFSVQGIPGIRLEDAISGQLSNLDNRLARPVLRPVPRITLRIMWPGYSSWTHESITVRHHGPSSTAFSMEELARVMSTRIQGFYTEMANTNNTEPQWNLRLLPFNRLYLIELRHISPGSWQPVICVNLGL
ncbi:hypothetical protein BDW22DRAFT_1198434 [Trametopsis cervina]|nr:hypothetical protein BDW22DRAFT_1198434 [Trametopsis cervina]